MTFDRLLHRISTTTACLRKSKIVVGRNVESASFRARVYLRVIAILRVSIIDEDGTSSDTGDGM